MAIELLRGACGAPRTARFVYLHTDTQRHPFIGVQMYSSWHWTGRGDGAGTGNGMGAGAGIGGGAGWLQTDIHRHPPIGVQMYSSWQVLCAYATQRAASAASAVIRMALFTVTSFSLLGFGFRRRRKRRFGR